MQVSVGSGTPGAALVKQNQAIAVGIEKPAVVIFTARTRAAMQKYSGNPAGIPHLLHVQLVPSIDRKGMSGKWFNWWIEHVHYDDSLAARIDASPPRISMVCFGGIQADQERLARLRSCSSSSFLRSRID